MEQILAVGGWPTTLTSSVEKETEKRESRRDRQGKRERKIERKVIEVCVSSTRLHGHLISSPKHLYPDVPPVLKPLAVRHPRLKQWLNSGGKEGGGHKSFTVQCDDGRFSVTMDKNILQVSIYQLKTSIIKTFSTILYDINIIPVAQKFTKK